MGDNIRLHDRSGVRTPMQWDTGLHAGFSFASEIYAPVIDDPVYGYKRVNVADQLSNPTSLLFLIHQFITTYKAEPALALGDIRFLHHPDRAMLAFERTYRKERILCLHNLSNRGIPIQTPTAYDLLADVTWSEDVMTLPPYYYRWLKVR
jgi:maltose alpha-D-glucosyltransferase/alpha-amylase